MNQFIYILLNPAHKNLLKIGRTSRNPEIRAQELSMATGVPQPFLVAYESLVSDAILAEQLIHQELSREGYRTNPSREFFEVPLKVAISVVDHVCKSLPTVDDDLLDEEFDVEGVYGYGWNFIIEGRNHLTGTESVFQDFGLARLCFEKAVAIGSSDAYIELADIHLWGLGVRENSAEAFRLLQEGAKKGNVECIYRLWEIYSGTAFNMHGDEQNSNKYANPTNADVAFKLYIDSITASNAVIDLAKAKSYLHWALQLSPLKTVLLGKHTNTMIEVWVDATRVTISKLKAMRIAKITIEQAKDAVTGQDLTLRPILEFKELWGRYSHDPSSYIKAMLVECEISDLEYGFSRLPLQRANERVKEYASYLAITSGDPIKFQALNTTNINVENKSSWWNRLTSIIN